VSGMAAPIRSSTHAKMIRLETPEREEGVGGELKTLSLNCSKCGLEVHWLSGLGVSPGHWAHREGAALHGEPVI
jgi:hypothetical protein